MPRQCGECTLCCTLLPVVPLNKHANERCKHQSLPGCGGCAVYRKPGFPKECRLWNCRWIVNDDTADLERPDKVHYVVDVMPDFVEAVDNETKKRTVIEVTQIWVDPKYPDAHKDPALRDFVARRARENKLALIRYNETDAFTLIAPIMVDDGQWHEMHGESAKRTHSAAEIFSELGYGPFAKRR